MAAPPPPPPRETVHNAKVTGIQLKKPGARRAAAHSGINKVSKHAGHSHNVPFLVPPSWHSVRLIPVLLLAISLQQLAYDPTAPHLLVLPDLAKVIEAFTPLPTNVEEFCVAWKKGVTTHTQNLQAYLESQPDESRHRFFTKDLPVMLKQV